MHQVDSKTKAWLKHGIVKNAMSRLIRTSSVENRVPVELEIIHEY
jgi:hypothetical protein